MIVKIIERHKLKKAGYSPDALHMVLPNGLEMPIFRVQSPKVLADRAFGIVQQELWDDIARTIDNCAKTAGLYGDDVYYVVDSYRPVFTFDQINGELFMQAFIDVCIPYRQTLEF